MARPCQWPDGGCGELVEFFPTGKTKPNGKPVLQVVDARPQKRIILVHDTGNWCNCDSEDRGRFHFAKVVDTYLDHHATCVTWLAKMEREARARAGL